MRSALIVFWSTTGNTEEMADMIKAESIVSSLK